MVSQFTGPVYTPWQAHLAMGQLFLRMVHSLLMMDGLQGGWFSNDAALLLDTCKGTMASPTIHWACVYPHGKPIWSRDNCFSGWFTFLLLLLLMDGLQGGWFSVDAVLLLDGSGPHGRLHKSLGLCIPPWQAHLAMGQLFLRMVHFVVYDGWLMDGLQGGWFSNDAAMLLGASGHGGF